MKVIVEVEAEDVQAVYAELARKFAGPAELAEAKRWAVNRFVGRLKKQLEAEERRLENDIRQMLGLHLIHILPVEDC